MEPPPPAQQIVVQQPDNRIDLARTENAPELRMLNEHRRELSHQIEHQERVLDEMNEFIEDVTNGRYHLNNRFSVQYRNRLHISEQDALTYYHSTIATRRRIGTLISDMIEERDSLLPPLHSVTVTERQPPIPRLNVFRAQPFRNPDTTEYI